MRHLRHLLTILAAGTIAACGSDGSDTAPMADSTALEPRASTAGSPAGSPAAESGVDSLEGAPRIVFIGTSLTAGLGLDDPLADSWPARTAEIAREAGTPVDIVNAGVSGDTSAGGLRRIGGLLDRPTDIVVVELGANDGLRGLSVEALRSNLSAVIDTVRSRRPEAEILLVPMEAPRNLGAEYVRSFRSVYTDLGTRPGVTLAPFLLEGVAGDPQLNQRDGIHPTEEGHRRMARTVWPALEPLVDRAAAERDGR